MNLNITPIKSFKKIYLLTGLVCLLTVMISSCGKGSDATVTTTTLTVVAASPDAPSTYMYIGGNLVSATPLVYGSFIPYFNSGSGSVIISSYYSSTSVKYAADTVNLAANKAYTLFVSNLLVKHDYFLSADTVVAPASGKASVRLANLSPDAPNLDLVVGGQVIASNQSYKHISSFKPIATSDNDTLKVVQTGTNNVLGVVNAVTVQAGVVYTIWLSGFQSGLDGYTLQANLMRNAAF